MLIIKSTQLKAALICAAKKDIRTYLNGVYFDPAGFMVGCDGHRMLVQKIAAFEGEAIIVPREQVDLAIKAAGKNGSIELTRQTIGYVPYASIEGTYPQWRKVIPEDVTGEAGAYNVDYVCDFKKIQELITGRDSSFGAHSIAGSGENGPGVAIIAEDVFGIIMPMRGIESAKADISAVHAMLAA